MFNLIVQKAIARKKALAASTTTSRDIKEMFEPLLAASYMYSDESVIVSKEESEEQLLSLGPATQGKKLVKKRTAWRSTEFQGYIDSLNHKIERRLYIYSAYTPPPDIACVSQVCKSSRVWAGISARDNQAVRLYYRCVYCYLKNMSLSYCNIENFV